MIRRTPSARPPKSRRSARATAPAVGLGHHVVELEATELNRPAPIVFTTPAWNNVRDTVGARRAESGGPLGGSRGSGVVEEFVDDTTADMTAVTYYPDFQGLNTLFRERWNPAGVNLLGVIHSHPRGAVRPSRNDLEYADRILAGIPELDRFLLPIAQTRPDTGRFTVHGYAAVRNHHGVHLDELDTIVLPPVDSSVIMHPEFNRIVDAYDGTVMASTRIVGVGVGGSASFVEDLVRAGIGEIVLIDPDIVEAPNIATQQAYRSDIGRAKVAAVAERLVDISPTVRVWTVTASLDDLDDAAMRRLCSGWLPGAAVPRPTTTLLCAFTDDFHAQARIHRLGLHLGVPVLGGTVYAAGRGVEVTFAADGLTPACIRCAQSSRYAAYLDRGFRNDVGSAGAPIWATARLNALKLPIALGILHTLSPRANPDHPATRRYRRLAETFTGRNLVLASLDPDIHETLGLRAFSSDHDVETTLWRTPVPDAPGMAAPRCPDCGGTGDLAASMGRFIDTRPLPRHFGDARHTEGNPREEAAV